MPTVIHPTYTNGLLKTDNKLSELGVDAATQKSAMDKIGVQYAIPIGAIVAYGGSSPPPGFMVCGGASISRTTYADLFSVIGTTFGTASGSTFNLPNITSGWTVSSGTLMYIIKFANISGKA